MADSSDDLSAWPRSPHALADVNLCPGCFTTITAAICPSCGFALTDPKALQVLALGRSILSYEMERQRVIEEVRMAHWPVPVAAEIVEVVSVPVPMPVAAPVPADPTVVDSAPAADAQQSQVPVAETLTAAPVAREAAALDAVPAAAPEAAASIAPRAPRRRLTVPALLLIVGVSLVGVAAIFFLVYAWFTASIAVRALIIAGITVATIATASLLRRRALTATAEGIAALGVLLLALDAWAVRANDFFDTAQVQPAVYAGVGILAVGVLCRVWARLSRLRTPDIAAVLALPVGVGLLVGGLTSLPTAEAIVAGLLGAAAGGLAHALPAPWSSARARTEAVPERTTLAVIGVAALVTAAILAVFVSLDSIALPLWSGAAIIVLGAAHTLLLRGRGADEPLPAAPILAGTAASTAAAVATVFGWQLAIRADEPVYMLLLAPVIAVAVPVLLDRLRARRIAPVAALVTAAILGAVSLMATLVTWAVRAAQAMSAGWVPWQTDAFSAPVAASEGALFAAVAGVVIGALFFFAPTLSRPGLREARAIAAAVLVIGGAAVTAVPAIVVGVSLLVSAIAMFALARSAARIGAGWAAAVGATAAYVTGTATLWLWFVGIAVALAVSIGIQVIVRPVRTAVAAALTLSAVGVATVSAFLAPYALSSIAGAPIEWMVAYVLVQWVALAALLWAVLLPCSDASRTTLALSAYGLFVFSLWPYVAAVSDALGGSAAFAITAPPAVLGEPILAIVRAALLLALLALVALGRTRVARLPRLGAAALVAPVASYGAFAVVQAVGLEGHGARALATVGAAVTVVWVAALWTMLRPAELRAEPAPDATLSAGAPAVRVTLPVSVRAMVDLGALATTLALAWGVADDLRWAMLAIVAVGFAGVSLARGWAAPATARIVGVPSTASAGVTTASAPRRLAAWPAFAFATGALWSALWAAPDPAVWTVEAYVIPPAAGLLGFTLLLVWLRRHIEAAIAVAGSFVLGLAVPAVAGWSDSPVRGTVVALVSAALCLLLTCTPAIRARIPALTGAATALLALALVAVERAVNEPVVHVTWLLLLLTTAYVSAVFAARSRTIEGGPSWYAIIVPPVAIAAVVGAGLFAAEHAAVFAVALVVFAALHLAAAAIDRAPFGGATRWTSLAGAALFAAGGFVGGAVTIEGVAIIELATLPVALIVLAGSALGQWRRHRAGLVESQLERAAWLAGLAIAIVPSIVAPVEPLRVWLGVVVPLVLALGAVLAPVGGARSLRFASAALLSAGSLAVATRAVVSPFEFSELAAIVAGGGALLVAAAMIWTEASTRLSVITALAGAGAALLVATVFVFGDGDPARTAVTALIAGTVGVGGAALLGLERWRGFGAVLAVGGLVGALAAVGVRFFEVFEPGVASLEPDFWALIGLAITAAIGVMALRATAGSPVDRPVATAVGVAFAVALGLFMAAERMMLAATDADQVRTVFTMSALTLAGVGGAIWRSRLGLVLPITAAVAAGLFGLSALVMYAVTPVELVTVPPALGLIALGARTLRRDPQSRTWPTVGPGLALLLIPSLLHDFFGGTDLWRIVGLGVVAVALVVVGAVWRLQAPLVLGSVVLLVHGIAQLWPWISTAYVYVPWWLWLGIGGALLIFLAARYERNVRAMRTSITAVTSLR